MELERIRKKQFVCSPTNSMLKMDPIIPFLQDFLSSVEILELQGGNGTITVYPVKPLIDVPYMLIYANVTSKLPHLKYLKVNCITEVTSWVLSFLAEFLCKTSTCPPLFACSGTELASTAPGPYFLKGLSFEVGCL